MPTPFMHLSYAEALIVDPRLNPAVAEILAAEWPSFYLGSVAADYQAICDTPRAKTHFYKNPVPREETNVGYVRLLDEYPELSDVSRLDRVTAVFQAGYNVHLLYDVYWLRQILVPFILEDDSWGGADIQTRFMSHHTLLTYLDKHALQAIQAIHGNQLYNILANAPILHLPYIQSDHLATWQTNIAEQLLPDAPSKTISVYAKRLKMTPEQFAINLADKGWMQKEVFDRIPHPSIRVYQESAQEQAVQLLNTYFSPVV